MTDEWIRTWCLACDEFINTFTHKDLDLDFHIKLHGGSCLFGIDRLILHKFSSLETSLF